MRLNYTLLPLCLQMRLSLELALYARRVSLLVDGWNVTRWVSKSNKASKVFSYREDGIHNTEASRFLQFCRQE